MLWEDLGRIGGGGDMGLHKVIFHYVNVTFPIIMKKLSFKECFDLIPFMDL